MKSCIAIATFVFILIGCSDREAVSEEITASQQSNNTYPYAPLSALVEKPTDQPTQAELNKPTQVIVLGTGTPIPDAYRAGPSIAVVHKGKSYLFDVGAGTIRRAVEARYKYDIPSLYPSHIDHVFITHMHSDHVLDFVELSQTLWWRRKNQLNAFGPTGLLNMSNHMEKMMSADIETRLSSVQPVPNPEGFHVIATEISDGVVFEGPGIEIEAFTVPHGDIKPAFGYKIVTEDLSIVISGDTAASDIIREKAQGVDLLFHEVISDQGLLKNSEFWQKYHKAAHTGAIDVGKIAADAQPKKLVLYHGLYYGTEEHLVVNEVSTVFKGEIVLANDLDIFSAE